MKRNLILAVVKYVPDFDRNEIINVGVILHSPKDQYLKSSFVKNLNRISKFDDELDIDFFKLYTETLNEEFSYSLRLFENKYDISDELLVKKLSQNYVNQFVFDIKNVQLETNSLDKTFDQYSKFMLHYDYDKKSRLKKNEKLELVKEFFSFNSIEFEILGQNKLKGRFDEFLNPELKIDNILIKIFRFDESNYRNFTDQVKAWAFNSKELDTMGYKVVFVIEDDINNDYTHRYKQILESYSDVYYNFNDENLLKLLSKKKTYLDSLRQS